MIAAVPTTAVGWGLPAAACDGGKRGKMRADLQWLYMGATRAKSTHRNWLRRGPAFALRQRLLQNMALRSCRGVEQARLSIRHHNAYPWCRRLLKPAHHAKGMGRDRARGLSTQAPHLHRWGACGRRLRQPQEAPRKKTATFRAQQSSVSPILLHNSGTSPWQLAMSRCAGMSSRAPVLCQLKQPRQQLRQRWQQ